MLVLTRKNNQKIQIGDNVTLTILNVKGNTVKVGIDAPRDIRVLRGELPVATQAQVSQSAGSQSAGSQSVGSQSAESQSTDLPMSRVKEISIVYSDEPSTEIMRSEFKRNEQPQQTKSQPRNRKSNQSPAIPLTQSDRKPFQGNARLRDIVKQITGQPNQSLNQSLSKTPLS